MRMANESVQDALERFAPFKRDIRPGKRLSVGVPRRLREHDLAGSGQSRRRDPVELSVLPLPDPPSLLVKVVLQLDLAQDGLERARFVLQMEPCDVLVLDADSAGALERALRESEELYRTTFQLAGVGVAHVSSDGRWMRVNQKLCDIVGYSESELLRMAFHDVTHPQDVGTNVAAIEELRNGKLDKYSVEKRYVRKDGSTVWVNLTVSAVRDASGKLKHFISVVEDIDERRVAEEAQGRLAAIVQSSDDAIVSKDLNGIITSWNVAAERIFGFTRDEAVGSPVTIIIPPELQDEEKQILGRLRKGERIDHFETVRITKSGRRLNVSLTISPVKDRSGSIVGASKVARDITERRRSERALRESEERFRAIVETTPECVKLVGIDGTLLHMNPPGLAMVGATCPEMVVGKNVYDIIAAHDREKFRIFNEDVCHGKRGTLEFDIVGLDGVGHHMETHAAPMTMPDGSVVQLAVTSDITERVRVRETLRKNEEQLRMLADDLEKQVRARTQELEARNAEVLQQSEQLRELSNRLLQTQDDERRHIARELHDSAGQIIVALGMNLASMTPYAAKLSVMDKTVEDSQNLIKQLSREIRTTSYLLHPPLLDENGLPEAIRWYVEGLMERSGLSIKLDIAEDFGRLDSETELAMFRIVQECLTNIHRHSGSKTAKIRLSRNAESVSLEIQDEGKGMAAHKLDGVRAHRSGVGITGMRERVRHLNGAMDINSNANGTKISVKLPASENDISQPGNIGQERGLELAG